MNDETLPSRARDVAEKYPDVWKRYQGLGAACSNAGPLDLKNQRLAKLALAIGAGSEGAVHSHARRGLREGLTADELRHVAILAITTLGFSKGVAALTWLDDILQG
jgi:alkylhydroperoxidase/carboxymuconolactone decarboxylase family protein YurZ